MSSNRICWMSVKWVRSLSDELFFFSSRRRHTRFDCDWSSDVCSSDLTLARVPQAFRERADALRGNGETVVFLVEGGRVAGIIGVADPIKASTPEALRALAAEGVRVVMLTGDSELTARAVAGRLGIEDVRADVLPQEKGVVVRALREEGRAVAMAGDGVNDAPALAEADVGIAMGTGSDIAIRSAGITLVKGDPPGIVRARGLSRAPLRKFPPHLVLAVR